MEGKTYHVAGTFATPVFNFSDGDHKRVERNVGSMGSVKTFDVGLAVRLRVPALSQNELIYGNPSDRSVEVPLQRDNEPSTRIESIREI